MACGAMHFPEEDLSREAHSTSIWVIIFNILLKGWNKEGIATVMSALGHPIQADFMIEDRSRMSFALVCLEMDVSLAFPNFVTLD